METARPKNSLRERRRHIKRNSELILLFIVLLAFGAWSEPILL